MHVAVARQQPFVTARVHPDLQRPDRTVADQVGGHPLLRPGPERARLAEHAPEDLWKAQPQVERHESAHRHAQHTVCAGRRAHIEQTQPLGGQRQYALHGEPDGGVAARVFDHARRPAVLDQRQGDRPDTPLRDQVVDDLGEPATAVVVAAIPDHHQRDGIRRGRLVEPHRPLAADHKRLVFHDMPRDRTARDAAHALRQQGRLGARHIKGVIDLADAVRGRAAVERIRCAVSLRRAVEIGVFDVRVRSAASWCVTRAPARPPSIRRDARGVPAMQVAQQQRRLVTLPDEGRSVSVDDRRAVFGGAGEEWLGHDGPSLPRSREFGKPCFDNRFPRGYNGSVQAGCRGVAEIVWPVMGPEITGRKLDQCTLYAHRAWAGRLRVSIVATHGTLPAAPPRTRPLRWQ